MRIQAVVLLLSIVSCARAGLLSTIQLPSSGSDIAFGVYVVNGPGDIYRVNDSEADTVYSVPLSDLSLMYRMVHDPAPYTARGPLWVRAQYGELTWTAFYDAISYSHTDTGFGGSQTCCATIDASGSVLNTPWQAVTLVRSPSMLTVSIYDIAVPEPSNHITVGILLWMVSVEFRLWWIRFRVQNKGGFR